MNFATNPTRVRIGWTSLVMWKQRASGVVVLLDREHRRRCLGPRLSEDCALRGVVDLEHLHAGVEVAGHGRE